MDELASLKWQIEMGADEALADEPVNRLAAKKPVANVAKITHVVAAPAESLSRSIAGNCNSLEELYEAVKNFNGLSIKKTATNTVLSDGNPKAKVMFIGEAPDADEDLEGRSFCGASGKLMDEMLKWVGISREKNMYITNAIFWRPPGNRRPTPAELATCRPFVERHIYLMKPELLVLVGGTAALSLLETKTGISKLRGKYMEYDNQYLSKPITTTILFHPAYLLRQPSQKKLFWKDLLNMKKFLGKNV